MAEIAADININILMQGEDFDKQVKHVTASDLMSDVLLLDEDGILLLTSLSGDQVLRTAQIVGAVGVVVVNNKPLPSSMITVAESLRMTLGTLPDSKYEACIKVHKALNKER